MTNLFNKRNLYIGSFSFLYVIVAVVSLIHSFSFFGLANTTIMSVLLGVAFEIGQAVVLFSILSTKKEQSKIVPWVLMVVLTLVQVMGNIFASYKYIVTNSVADLQYFKDPIFVWTNLPDKMTTVIVTYIVGAILPIIALLMTSTLADFINGSDASLEAPDDTVDDNKVDGTSTVTDTNNTLAHPNNITDNSSPTVDTKVGELSTEVEPTLESTTTTSNTSPMIEPTSTLDNSSPTVDPSPTVNTSTTKDNVVDDSSTTVEPTKEPTKEPNRFINL